MKIIKFLMLFLCGTFLSIGFSACSSSSDDNNNGGNGNANTKLEGTIFIDGKSYDVAYGCYSTTNQKIYISLCSYDDKSNSVPNSRNLVDIIIPTDKLAIPEGSVSSYKINAGLGITGESGSGKEEYSILSYHSGSYEYIPNGTRPCEITKNGDIYTINIPEMSMKCIKNNSGYLSNTTCSLKFVGKIPYHGHDMN